MNLLLLSRYYLVIRLIILVFSQIQRNAKMNLVETYVKDCVRLKIRGFQQTI